jgi:hypothetical protein
MTNEERELLLSIARWVSDREDETAKKRGTTSNWADDMRRLIENIRPRAGRS